VFVYHHYWHPSWNSAVQWGVNSTSATYTNPVANRMQVDWMKGMLRTQGYSAVRHTKAAWQRSWHTPNLEGNISNPNIPDVDAATEAFRWSNALKYDLNTEMAYNSTYFDNWDYAHSRYYSMPFAWLAPGPSPGPFDDQRSLSFVTTQLDQFRKWGMGRVMPIFHLGQPFSAYISGTYEVLKTATQAAAVAGNVDSATPQITVTTNSASTIAGYVTDNFAVRSMTWRDTTNSGMAALTFQITSGGIYDIGAWRMNFTIAKSALGSGNVTLTAYDTHGRSSTQVVTP
jgi:hypothetical protein